MTLDERNGVQFLFDAFEDLTPEGLAASTAKVGLYKLNPVYP
jgi:hypothetical protein